MADTDNRFNALHDHSKGEGLSRSDKAYSGFVTKLRWILPISAVVIVTILMIWPKIQIEISQNRFAPAPVDRAALEKAAAENRLANAKFSSIDGKGRPFSITAAEAVQDSKTPDNVILQTPSGTLKMNGDVTMTANAKGGIYQQEKQVLELNENVVLTRSDGTTLQTQTMLIDLATSNVSASTPVEIDGPQGHLTAQSMTMTNGGATTIFKGPVKLILKTGNSINPKGGTQ